MTLTQFPKKYFWKLWGYTLENVVIFCPQMTLAQIPEIGFFVQNSQIGVNKSIRTTDFFQGCPRHGPDSNPFIRVFSPDASWFSTTKIIFTGVFRDVSNFLTWKHFGMGNFSLYQDQNENWDSKHHKTKLKKSDIVEFESFPFEVLQIFGDYIDRVGRTLTVLELVQFFEFCHFLGLERVCKGQGSPDVTQF